MGIIKKLKAMNGKVGRGLRAESRGRCEPVRRSRLKITRESGAETLKE